MNIIIFHHNGVTETKDNVGDDTRHLSLVDLKNGKVLDEFWLTDAIVDGRHVFR